MHLNNFSQKKNKWQLIGKLMIENMFFLVFLVGSVLGPLLFILFTTDLGNSLEKKIISFVDFTTFFANISKPGDRIGVASSLNRDLAKIKSSFEIWG